MVLRPATRPFLPPATQNRTLSTSFFPGSVLAPPEGEGPVLGGVCGGVWGGTETLGAVSGQEACALQLLASLPSTSVLGRPGNPWPSFRTWGN